MTGLLNTSFDYFLAISPSIIPQFLPEQPDPTSGSRLQNPEILWGADFEYSADEASPV